MAAWVPGGSGTAAWISYPRHGSPPWRNCAQDWQATPFDWTLSDGNLPGVLRMVRCHDLFDRRLGFMSHLPSIVAVLAGALPIQLSRSVNAQVVTWNSVPVPGSGCQHVTLCGAVPLVSPNATCVLSPSTVSVGFTGPTWNGQGNFLIPVGAIGTGSVGIPIVVQAYPAFPLGAWPCGISPAITGCNWVVDPLLTYAGTTYGFTLPNSPQLVGVDIYNQQFAISFVTYYPNVVSGAVKLELR